MYQLTVDELLKYKDHLRPEYYVVLMLRANCIQQKVVANQLQIPVGTVKSRLNRGMRDLGKLKEANAARQDHLSTDVSSGEVLQS